MSTYPRGSRPWQAVLAETTQELRRAEEELDALKAEIQSFEAEVDRFLGSLLDQLSTLDQEIRLLNAELRRQRDEKLFGDRQVSYYPGAPRPGEPPPIYNFEAEEEKPPGSPQPRAEPSQPTLKELYRKLARRYHPDLAAGDADRALRNEKMSAINQAFATGNIAELRSLAGLVSAPFAYPELFNQAARSAAEDELTLAQRRLEEVRQRIQMLNRLPSVQFSLEVKLARRQGRDLLAEMIANLQRKVNKRTAERDYLRAMVNPSLSTS
ncbi:MAG: hypothetical protein JW726_19835 [Anaerolineales bacterium]|nr:hypothetical protein [Anaerolineales bacterium]